MQTTKQRRPITGGVEKIKSVIINRHNYEEFFLLYADNELLPEQRKLVELFIVENPDLSEEMETLKQVTLQDENVVFEQKGLLYKQAARITSHNYEDYFLLSVDKELTQQQNEEVEKFVLQHPHLQDEYTLLNQTRLQPEVVVFEEKENLYRQTAKEKPVIFLNWIRISVAAAVIGIVATTWFIAKNNQYRLPDNAVATTKKQAMPLPAKTRQPVKPTLKEETAAVLPEKKAQKVAAETRVKKVQSQPEKANKSFAASTPQKKKVSPVLPVVTTDATSQNKIPKKNIGDEEIAAVKTTNKNNLPAVDDNSLNTTFANNSTGESHSLIVTHAVYREIDNQQDDEENTFYIGSAQINKNKLKGLFKKATGFFGKLNNKNDGDKTLKIAGFQIKSN